MLKIYSKIQILSFEGWYYGTCGKYSIVWFRIHNIVQIQEVTLFEQRCIVSKLEKKAENTLVVFKIANHLNMISSL